MKGEIEMKGSSTSRSESSIPDSELVCRFCGKNDRQHDMHISRTGRTAGRKVLRIAWHNKCQVAYKKRLKQLREHSKEAATKGGGGDVDVELDTDFTSQTPAKRNSLFSRLINS